MKKLLLLVIPALLFACVDYTDDLIAIDERLDKLEQTIPTIEEQIASIQTSIDALKAIDKELDDNIKALEESDKATAEEIAALKEADKAIELRIAELQKYVDDSLKSAKDWAIATFATLEQLNALSSEVVALKNLVGANKIEAAANLATAISSLETSLKSWVGTQLSNYYTIAEVEAKITALQTAITEGDNALQEELNKLKTQLETAKSEITAAYKKAIEEAINTNNGVINNKIASEIATVNQRIDSEVAAINAKMAELQAQVNQNTADIANLLARIQSVSYLPEYNDGKVLIERMASTSWGTLSFRISPKDAVAELEKVWSEALSSEAYYPKTRAVSLVKLAVTGFEGDAENGVVTVKVSGVGLSEEFFAGTQEAKIALVISDGNNQVVSDYADAYGQEVTNEIWYTTTDGNVLEPKNAGIEIFGANIVSNTYENGKGVIKFDGTVTMIGEEAFGYYEEIDDDKNYMLQTITLPNSVTTIAKHAFAYICDELVEITIPDSVTSIGRTAFGNLAKLERATLGKNVESLGMYAFSKCTNLKSINIPEKVTAIPDHCFRNTAFTDFAIPNNITSIGIRAFRDCDKLVEVYIPGSIEMLAEGAFQSCVALKNVVFNEGLKKIGYQCFASCKQLQTIAPPNSVEEVEPGAFAYANVLYFEGKFASEDKCCLIVNGVLKKLADSTPEYYTLPSTVTTLGQNSIASIKPAKAVHLTFPDSLNDIGPMAFGQTYNIAGFYGKYASEDHRAVIKDNVLYGVTAYGITKYSVAEGVVKIAEYAFDTIKYLKEITLPSTLVEIETRSLKVGNNDIYTLYCKAVVPPVLGVDVFNGLEYDKIPTIYVPTASVNAYKTADGWKDYADYIVGYDF